MAVDDHGFTKDEIREFVHEYYVQPFGTRKEWLARQPVTEGVFRRWRRMVVHGDVERGLVPREHLSMVPTHREVTAFEKARAKEIAAHQAEVEKLQKRIAELEGSNDALGKAIGLLHKLNEPGPATVPMKEPRRSSPRKTTSSGT